MSAWPELRLAAANLGAADVLEKPFGNEELTAAIERVRRLFRRP
jgi:DNA-binding response OmpR family regulator